MVSANHIVFIALGTNLGNRLKNLRTALRELAPTVVPVRLSPIYETPPWGYADQPAFLNAVVQAETSLAPIELLDFLKAVEKKMGRESTMVNGPRVIDLDIIFYDELAMRVDRLEIPHPRLEGRAFVLVPLADLDPDWINPAIGETITQMLKRSDRSGIEPYPVPDGMEMLPKNEM